MKIAHMVIQEVVTNFIGNQPITKLTQQLFSKGAQVRNLCELVKHNAFLFSDDGVVTLRMHWSNVVPSVMQNIETTDDLDTVLRISVKGLEADVVVIYDKPSMWFNIRSKTFDNLLEVAAERAKE